MGKSFRTVDLAYTWEIGQIPQVSRSADFDAIMFSLAFTAYEEQIVNVLYNRDYTDGTRNFDSSTENYHFNYYVGIASAWNHNITTVSFEFYIPKSLCDDLDHERYLDHFEITDQYYIGAYYFSNWLPEDLPFISVYWTHQVLFTPMQEVLTKVFLIIVLVALGIVGLFIFIRRKKRFDLRYH